MLIYIIPDLKVIGTTCLHKVDFIQNVVTCNIENSKILLAVFFYFFSFAKMFYIIFYPSYVSICKDLQKTIVLSSGPFLQLFTFTIQLFTFTVFVIYDEAKAVPQRSSQKTLLC